jgi:hypothetical protein
VEYTGSGVLESRRKQVMVHTLLAIRFRSAPVGKAGLEKILGKEAMAGTDGDP